MAKTVAAGLALDLADEAALRTAWERMEERFGSEMAPALVQTMVEPGVDVAIAVHDHPEVGPVISLRPGGANAALDQDAELQVLPIGDRDASGSWPARASRPTSSRPPPTGSWTSSCGWARWWRRCPRSSACGPTRSSSRDDAATVIEAGIRGARGGAGTATADPPSRCGS